MTTDNIAAEEAGRIYLAEPQELDFDAIRVYDKNVEMKTITFYGSSDDLVEIGGDDVLDEINTHADSNQFRVIHQPDDGRVEGITVYVEYSKMGLWGVKVEPLEEGFPIPNWLIRIGQPHYSSDYSTMLTVHAPPNTYVERVTD